MKASTLQLAHYCTCIFPSSEHTALEDRKENCTSPCFFLVYFTCVRAYSYSRRQSIVKSATNTIIPYKTRSAAWQNKDKNGKNMARLNAHKKTFSARYPVTIVHLVICASWLQTFLPPLPTYGRNNHIIVQSMIPKAPSHNLATLSPTVYTIISYREEQYLSPANDIARINKPSSFHLHWIAQGPCWQEGRDHHYDNTSC